MYILVVILPHYIWGRIVCIPYFECAIKYSSFLDAHRVDVRIYSSSKLRETKFHLQYCSSTLSLLLAHHHPSGTCFATRFLFYQKFDNHKVITHDYMKGRRFIQNVMSGSPCVQYVTLHCRKGKLTLLRQHSVICFSLPGAVSLVYIGLH